MNITIEGLAIGAACLSVLLLSVTIIFYIYSEDRDQPSIKLKEFTNDDQSTFRRH